jgi:hypothetical protein
MSVALAASGIVSMQSGAYRVAGVQMQRKKPSKSAPGGLLKVTESRPKSDAGQAAEAAGAAPPSSTGSAAGDPAPDVVVSKKKDRKGLKGAVELVTEQTTKTTKYLQVSSCFRVCTCVQEDRLAQQRCSTVVQGVTELAGSAYNSHRLQCTHCHCFAT